MGGGYVGVAEGVDGGGELMWVAFAERVSSRCIAGSPSRQPGNFLLRGQKKVTKEEALNRTPAPHARAAPCNSHSLTGKTRPAALSLLSLSPAPVLPPPARLTRGCTPGSPENQMQRRSGDTTEVARRSRRPSDAAFPDEFGVQPTLSGVKGRWMVIVIGTAARAQRVASARNGGERFRAPLLAVWCSCAVQRLFFGDFLLAPCIDRRHG